MNLNHALLRVTLVIVGFALMAMAVYQAVLPEHTMHAKHLAHQHHLTTCTVLTIYDGDTLGCDFNDDGQITNDHEKVRLLHVDAAEMHYSKKNTSGKDQPFALEAKQFLEDRVLNQSVFIETDIKKYDKYGRTLAFLYADADKKTMLNLQLVEHGLAKLMMIPPNQRYQAQFEAMQATAQKNHYGLFSQHSR